MFSENYVRLVLAVAPFLVCLAFSLEPRLWKGRWPVAYLFSAALFSVSVFGPIFSVWGCLPWLLLSVLTAGLELKSFVKTPDWSTSNLALLAGLLYLPVGGVWALFDQLLYQPLGFSHIIVLLTGVHFHYAGFALPRLTGYWLQEEERARSFQLAGWGVILGVPLVAIGITSSQLRMPFWVETAAVTVLASAAFTISLGYLQWSRQLRGGPRALFALAGCALAGGMVLATLYGWREVVRVEWITIPAMYAVHGTLNSWGFCLPGFVAWKLLGLGSHNENGV